MTLLIAWILLTHFSMDWWWYAISIVVWLLSFPMHGLWTFWVSEFVAD
jgi:hypothetical protein